MEIYKGNNRVINAYQLTEKYVEDINLFFDAENSKHVDHM